MDKFKSWYKSISPRAQKVFWDITIAILSPMFFLIVSLPALLFGVSTISTADGGVYRGGGVCRALYCHKQNKGVYAHLTGRGAEIPGAAKSDCTAVKLAQDGK